MTGHLIYHTCNETHFVRALAITKNIETKVLFITQKESFRNHNFVLECRYVHNRRTQIILCFSHPPPQNQQFNAPICEQFWRSFDPFPHSIFPTYVFYERPLCITSYKVSSKQTGQGDVNTGDFSSLSIHLWLL